MAKKKISKPTWQSQLESVLASLAKDKESLHLAILGIGNEFNGDDAAGVLVLRALRARLGQQPGLLLLETGTAPENFAGSLRRFQPDLVIFLDSADMGMLPGAVTWVDWRNTEGLSASTHSLPPFVFASYLVQELGCRVALLGIQVGRVGFNEAINPPVRLAIRQVAQGLSAGLKDLLNA
jgi:hydrogenase 3 maturation protease